jgi:hypothetical protein
MALGKDKLDRMALQIEDSFINIRGSVKLLEMIYDDWCHLHVHNFGSSNCDEFFEMKLGIASKLRDDLKKVKEELHSTTAWMINETLLHDADRMQPILRRIERRFNNQMKFYPDLFSPSNKAADQKFRTITHQGDVSNHTESLHKHYSWLLDKLDACSVANKMFEYRAISKCQLESVQAYHNNLYRASEILLRIVLDEPLAVYNAFKEALIVTNQDDIYLTLQGVG